MRQRYPGEGKESRSTPVDFLAARFREHPDRLAIALADRRCSFDDLARLGDRWRGFLGREGVPRGAVVMLNGGFTPNTIALLLALAAHDAIVVPAEGSDAPGSARRERIAQVEAHIRVDDDDEVELETAGRVSSHPLYEELRRRQHPGLVAFSSGSSGEPKAAVHDLVPFLAKFERRRPALSTIAFLRFDHLGGINTVLHALSNGAAVVSTAGDRSPDGVCRAVDEHRVELLPATPTFFRLLLLSGAMRRHDLSSLRVLSYGAEPMPAGVLERLGATFPNVRLQQTYGMIEVGALRTRSRDDGSLWVKVGGEGYETRVVDGILQIRARSMVLGYLNAPLPLTEDGFLPTGDMVEQDGDYLRFLGRDSDLINVGGEKVYPAEVEGVIEEMEDIEMATVHGEPNPLVGEIVCAGIKPSAGAPSTDLAVRVKRHCRERLARFKVPVKVALMGDVPVTDRFKKRRRTPHGVIPETNQAMEVDSG